jgi:origin recognition complex subunit 4
MVDFDPSPRSSKRRRTGTYATRRTTLNSADANLSKDEEETPQLLLNPQSGKAPADGLTESLREEAVGEDERVPPASQTNGHDEDPATIAHPKPSSASRRAVGNSNQKSRETIRSSAKGASSAYEQEINEATPVRRNSTKVDEGNNTADKSSGQEEDAETPGEIDDTADMQTRSSGRMRRLPKRFAVNEVSTDVNVVSERKSKSTTTRKPSSVRQQSIQSPQPKGILTPSRKGRRTGPRKSVVFDGDDDDKRIEEQLGFKDIDSSTKKKGKRVAKETVGEQEESSDIRNIEQAVRERATTPPDTNNDDEPLFDTAPDIEEILSQPTGLESTVNDQAQSATVEDNEHVIKIKVEILNRLTTNSLSPVAHLEREYTTLHTLLSATITAGESNSLLLLGSRGSGKTLLIEHALQDLTRKHTDDFHIVRLSGFFQTDDKLALREIWRQLGREMAVSEDETGEVSSYADTMASLLSLLSHPEEFDNVNAMDIDAAPRDLEKTSKSVIFILDEFDLFTTHPRQTLLYNLFDIAQAKKAPIAVVGCSTRMDVVDLLEKRVKSRFSHRWLHVASMKSLVAFEEAVRGILCLPVDGHEALGVSAGALEWRGKWNECIKVRFEASVLMTFTF